MGLCGVQLTFQHGEVHGVIGSLGDAEHHLQAVLDLPLAFLTARQQLLQTHTRTHIKTANHSDGKTMEVVTMEAVTVEAVTVEVATVEVVTVEAVTMEPVTMVAITMKVVTMETNYGVPYREKNRRVVYLQQELVLGDSLHGLDEVGGD